MTARSEDSQKPADETPQDLPQGEAGEGFEGSSIPLDAEGDLPPALGEEEELGEGVHASDLEDVLSVGYRTLKDALDELDLDQLSYGSLEGVFTDAAVAMESSAKRVKGTVPDGEQTKDDKRSTALRRDPEELQMSIAELEHEVAVLDASIPEREPLKELDNLVEEVSIMLQMLSLVGDDSTRSAILERLDKIADRRLGHEILGVWRGAFAEMAAELPFALFDRVFPIGARALRVYPVRTPMEEIADLARGNSAHGREALWPHAANELLLLGHGDRARIPKGILDLLDNLSDESMLSAVLRLGRLSALRDNRLAKVPFDPAEMRTFKLHATLLTTPMAAQIAPFIHAGLLSMPPAIEGAGPTLACLEAGDTRTVYFLRLLLLGARAGRASTELLDEARTLVAKSLEQLPIERRGEAWVPEAMHLLGQGRPGYLESVLRTVVSERLYGLFCTWPRASRKQAKRALKRLKAVRLSGSMGAGQ